jgi:hypothetical protein
MTIAKYEAQWSWDYVDHSPRPEDVFDSLRQDGKFWTADQWREFRALIDRHIDDHFD